MWSYTNDRLLDEPCQLVVLGKLVLGYCVKMWVCCCVGANAGLCCVLLGMLFGGYASVPEIILFAFLS